MSKLTLLDYEMCFNVVKEGVWHVPGHYEELYGRIKDVLDGGGGPGAVMYELFAYKRMYERKGHERG